MPRKVPPARTIGLAAVLIACAIPYVLARPRSATLVARADEHAVRLELETPAFGSLAASGYRAIQLTGVVLDARAYPRWEGSGASALLRWPETFRDPPAGLLRRVHVHVIRTGNGTRCRVEGTVDLLGGQRSFAFDLTPGATRTLDLGDPP